jgi:hypothetical protein
MLASLLIVSIDRRQTALSREPRLRDLAAPQSRTEPLGIKRIKAPQAPFGLRKCIGTPLRKGCSGSVPDSIVRGPVYEMCWCAVLTCEECHRPTKMTYASSR